MNIPTIEFSTVAHRINRLWRMHDNPHSVVWGPTGSGKSYLIRHGILPIRPHARVLMLDVKGVSGSTWDGFGSPLTELPTAFGKDCDTDTPMHYRLIVSDYTEKQLSRLLSNVLSEGHCVIVIDDVRSITRDKQIGLVQEVDKLMRDGREHGVSVIIGAQSPKWAIPSMKSQAGMQWIGRQSNIDEANQLSKFIGHGRDLVHTIAHDIRKRQWLYTDALEDEPILGITGI